jgi:hypothetical protein
MLMEEEKEKSSELEASLQELRDRTSEQQVDWKKSEKRYKEMLEQSQDHAKQMELATSALGKDSVESLKGKLKEKTDLIEELTAKFKALEDRTATAEEELKTRLQQSLKDMAIKEQQVEFQAIQLKELKS